MANEMDLAVEVTKAVAVEAYKDTVKPLAIEVGKALQTGGKVLNLMLSPLRGMVWSYETITDTLDPIMREKIQRIAADKLKHPEPNIAVPAMEALRYSLGNDEIREMFANLLATSMNVDTLNFAHPGFVEIIKQMSPLDAKIFKIINEQPSGNSNHLAIAQIRRDTKNNKGGHILFSEFMVFPDESVAFDIDLNSTSIVNLARLGLIRIDYLSQFTAEDSYNHLEIHPFYLDCKAKYNSDTHEVKLQQGIVVITPFGKTFKIACFDQ